MADVLIKDIEIPKKGNVGISIYADGLVEICGTGSLSKPIYGTPTTKAIEVKTHGRLVEADELLKKVRDEADFPSEEWGKTIECIENAPTVLEASKERE